VQQIEIEKIRTIIRRLKIKKALKLNKIFNKIIKIYKKNFIPHLQHLFNVYLKQKIYFKIYKKAKIIMFKKPGKKVGDYTKAEVYRPIIFLNTINKILEIILV